jgi:hypothetical protein
MILYYCIGFGAGSGLVLHTAGQWARKLKFTKASFNRNTLMLSVLGGGALGMFLFASSTGKQEVYKLHPIFQVGAMPQGELDYQKRLQRAKEISGEQDIDIKRLKEVQLVRRKSLMDKIEKGHGLSDAHGGHWYRDDDVDIHKMKDMRMTRRKSLMDNLERGKGLSDSHGGHWSR